MNGRTKLTRYAVAGALLVVCVFLGEAPALAAVTELVSASSSGEQGNCTSSHGSVSADGRYVAFDSQASNLVAGDTNAMFDVFVHDRLTGYVERISVSSAGVEAQGGDSYSQVVTPDGRYVVYNSSASNLVPGDTNGVHDVFLRDRLSGTTERISVSSAGVEGNGSSSGPTISADGRYVAFASLATNFAAGDSNSGLDVFVRDRSLGLTWRISDTPIGDAGNHSSDGAVISQDASCVVFVSYASDLVSGDTNGEWDIFVYDTSTGNIERVSVSSSGVQANAQSYRGTVSSSGRYVAFQSQATNLAGSDTNGSISDVFVRDRLTATTECVSVSSTGERGDAWSSDPAISADGRCVAFESQATNLVGRDTNDTTDAFLRNRVTGVTERVSVSSAGEQADYGSGTPTVNTDGRYVVYDSAATNLAGSGTNGVLDVFLRDRFGDGYAYPENVALSSSSELLETKPVTLTSLYRDANGRTDIKRCYLLLNDSLGQANAAFLWYDRGANRVYLKNDANTSWGTGYAPGVNITLENSQCYVYVGSTTVSGSGNDLTVNWRIALKDAFAAKSLTAYMYVGDAAAHCDGWERMGVFYNISPEALSIAPSTGPIPTDTWTTFTSYYSDQNGYQDLRKCYLLVNDSLTQSNAMFLLYDRKSNRVYLKNDENTSWGTGYAPGTDVILENSQCMVRVGSIASSHSGSNTAITWSFLLRSETIGKKNLYSWLYVTDSKEANSGYKRVGTHFTPIAPVCVSLSPSSGTVSTGVKTPFTALYSDDNGYGDIHKVYLQLSVTSSQANAVLLMYDAKLNKAYLRNDSNTSWGAGGVPGTAVTLENSQCTVELASMGTPSGVSTEQLEISWPIKLKWGMSGPRLCERMYVQDNALLKSGWRVMGYIKPL